jgi:hypothetical protein
MRGAMDISFWDSKRNYEIVREHKAIYRKTQMKQERKYWHYNRIKGVKYQTKGN